MNTCDRPLLFFDCETGGLDAHTADMVSFAWILTDPTGKDVLDARDFKVHPRMPVNPEAAKINGYSLEAWADAENISRVLPSMFEIGRDAVFAGHNAHFDWEFVSAAAHSLGLKWTGDYHLLDTAALLWPFMRAARIEKVRLEVALEYFDIVNEAPHTAVGDVRACRQLFLKVMRIYGRPL